ncbi:hypothetical protein D3C79_988620 [compost metagenome]
MLITPVLSHDIVKKPSGAMALCQSTRSKILCAYVALVPPKYCPAVKMPFSASMVSTVEYSVVFVGSVGLSMSIKCWKKPLYVSKLFNKVLSDFSQRS